MAKQVVLHLMNGLYDASISQIVMRLVSGLGPDEFRWFVGGLVPGGDLIDEIERAGATPINFSTPVIGGRGLVQKVNQFIQDNSVTIIHTHTMRTLLITWLATLSISPKSRKNIRHIVTKHTFTSPGDRRWGLFYAMFDRMALYLPDCIVPVSRAMTEKIIAQPGIRSNKVVFIQNSIPFEEWYFPEKRDGFRQRFSIPYPAIVIGFGGRLEQVKRLDLLIDAFALVYKRFPEVRLVLAGEGSLRHQLEKQVSDLGISAVVCWVGYCRDMPGFLSAIDIYVQCSTNEGLPLSILEAMAAGKAVVATRVGGIVEVLTHGEDGILIPPNSVSQLYDAISKLVESPEIRLQLGETARTSVKTKFGLATMINRYRQLYKGVGG